MIGYFTVSYVISAEENIGEFFWKISQYVKGQEAVHFLPLVTFPLSSVDELANQFQNCNQRVRNGDYSPENDD